ncbi:spike base protein, RCAP_Rcc01079 family [Palleronia sp. KMU-117]|uniref:spike base protein, RCAP_Rcc01079 family n=1 Tax=Palleronia sp. KMU-117 TaxID=3434108 RepID=UPI003D75E53A
MPDLFASSTPGLESPAAHLKVVTPSDSEDMPFASRALNVSGGGAVRVTTVAGDVATIAVVAGVPFPIRCRRVWATGTTATGIVAMY